ncbi:hypothetical protein BH10PSE15_BH10PSE15_01120 [soil metagenome]
MRRLISLLLVALLSVSVGLGSAAHALEPIASIDASEASYFGHLAGDSDEVPADADKGYPHHHGACHDHGVGMPATAQRIATGAALSQACPQQLNAILVSAFADTLRRPPRT